MADVPVPAMRDSGQGAGGGHLSALIREAILSSCFTGEWSRDQSYAPSAHLWQRDDLGLEGEVRIENFEMVGVRDFEAKGTFKVRKTHSQVLTPGQVNLVNLERGYIHGFQAGARGGRGLDITTRIREKRETPYLNLGKKPVEVEPGIYEASWGNYGLAPFVLLIQLHVLHTIAFRVLRASPLEFL